MIETNNVLSHPEGPEHQFLVGEGESAPNRSPAPLPPLLPCKVPSSDEC